MKACGSAVTPHSIQGKGGWHHVYERVQESFRALFQKVHRTLSISSADPHRPVDNRHRGQRPTPESSGLSEDSEPSTASFGRCANVLLWSTTQRACASVGQGAVAEFFNP